MMRLRLTILLLLFVPIILIGPAAAGPGDTVPFTIIRATLDDHGNWEVHRFTFPIGDELPAFIDVPDGATGFQCSILDYTLFRARHTLSFEGALQEGLSEELGRRDRIKRASYWGTYFFCPSSWPMHLIWELPFAGIEKERMLDTEGYTILLPIVESGSVGEIPLEISEPDLSAGSPWENSTNGTMRIIYPPMSEDIDWRGAGLYSSYFMKASELASANGDTSGSGFFPGWPEGIPGILLLMLDTPDGIATGIKIGDNPALLAALWSGRYDEPLENLVYVKSNGRAYLGFRRAKSGGIGPVNVGILSGGLRMPVSGNKNIVELRTPWPSGGSLLSKYPLVVFLIPGVILSFLVFHILASTVMRIGYHGKIAGALYEPVIAHITLLAFATILAPFLGLGWIAGAYVAGRFIQWRHPEAKRPWLMMAAYALLVTVAFEVIFAGSLWL